MTTTAAIILAAGGSTRMQTPKQLALLGEETLLQRALRAAAEAGCSPIKLVLGCAAGQILKNSPPGKAEIVINENWPEGMASSIRKGVQSLPPVEGTIVMTCDMPAVSATHLQKLITPGHTTASAYAGRHGVPAYFPRDLFPALLQLQGDAGAKELLHSAHAINLIHGDLDVDTPQDLHRARELFA